MGNNKDLLYMEFLLITIKSWNVSLKLSKFHIKAINHTYNYNYNYNTKLYFSN